jgi:hypothetical protein
MQLAMVTSERFPESHWQDQDTPQVVRQLKRSGARVDVVAWDSAPSIRWKEYDTLVLQSPWSMWSRLAAFQVWLDERVAEGAHLLNPAGVVSLGMNKRYLTQLAARGVATVPTVVIEDARACDDAELRGRLTDLASLVTAPRAVVVKPVSSGGALGAREFTLGNHVGAAKYIRQLADAGMGALIQPYMNSIDVHRELDVIMTNGEISHAITKAAILRPGELHHAFHPDARPHGELTSVSRAVVLNAYQRILEILPPGTPPPLSIRLDFVLDPDTDPELLLLEVETVAPVKFFPMFPEACEDYARQVIHRTKARRLTGL